MEAFSQLRLFFPDDPRLCQVDVKTSQSLYKGLVGCSQNQGCTRTAWWLGALQSSFSRFEVEPRSCPSNQELVLCSDLHHTGELLG